MTEERTSPAEETAGAPRAFPVPRNRPVIPPLEGFEEVGHEGEEAAPTRHRRVLEILLILAIAAIVTLLWLVTRPVAKPPPPAPPVVVGRAPSDDPAVEIYFTPSQPESVLPLSDDYPPLPVPPVSLDEMFGKEER